MSDNHPHITFFSYPKEFAELWSQLGPGVERFATVNLHIQKTHGLAGMRAAHEAGWSLELAGSPDFDVEVFLQELEEHLNGHSLPDRREEIFYPRVSDEKHPRDPVPNSTPSRRENSLTLLKIGTIAETCEMVLSISANTI